MSPSGNLFERFSASATRFPAKPAVFFQNRSGFATICYSELLTNALRAARRLNDMGIASGDIVSVMLPHSLECFHFFWGALALGAVPAFFPPPTPKQSADFFWTNHARLFDVNEISALVTSAPFFHELSQRSQKAKTMIDPAALADIAPIEEFRPAAANSVALLQHSSGTTGLKKGVMLTHRAVVEQLDAYGSTLGFGADDIVASWLPLYHDMGLITSLLLPLTSGATLVTIDPFVWTGYPPLLLEAMEAHRATFCWQPNFAFNLLARTKRRDYDLHSIKAFINCSEPCYPQTHEIFSLAFRKSGVDATKIQVCYAMAETVFAVSQTARSHAPALARLESSPVSREFISCGIPLSGAQIRILDGQGRNCMDGQIGQIHLCCSFMFNGYYRRPDITSEKLVDGWYSTGDLGFTRNGELFVIARSDDVIVAHGKNWHATDLESLVDGYQGVKAGRRIAVSDFNEVFGTNDIVMLVEQDASAEDMDLSALLGYLRETSGAPFSSVRKVPDGWIVKTTSGKLNRNENKMKFSKLTAPTGEH